jgi:dolichol-phosphate mannosyltransferase
MKKSKAGASRWLRFNAVGVVGTGVQFVVLVLLVRVVALNYLAATVLAVEAAVLHNFAWHRRWTWSDRTERSGALTALLRFNLSTGVISIVGNLIVMRTLVGEFGLAIPHATLATVVICSVFNFVVADRFVFV